MTIAGARRITAQFVQPNRNNTVFFLVTYRRTALYWLKSENHPLSAYYISDACKVAPLNGRPVNRPRPNFSPSRTSPFGARPYC